MDTLKSLGTSESSEVRRKLMNVWHSVKYGKTVFKLNNNEAMGSQPVWILGQCYHKQGPQTRSVSDQAEAERRVVAAFNADFYSRIWLTYRQDYEEFKGTSLTSDCGWGCMIRSGQMLIANALLMHYLGRDWRYNNKARVLSDFDLMDEARHRSLIRLFGDNRDDAFSPLSIHALMAIATETIRRGPGNWFGPASTANLINLAVAKTNHPLLNELSVYVARDGTIYLEDVKQLCRKTSVLSGASSPDLSDFSILNVDEASGTSASLSRSISQSEKPQWKPVLVLVPVRLGGEKLNPVYIPSIKMLLATDNCVGFIGGRPRHSVYFVGFQDDHLIHLDPHLVQDNVNVFLTRFQVSSFHCRTPRRMSVHKLDPSCCFGFLCTSESQFDGWCALTRELLDQCGAPYPIFSFVQGCQSDNNSVLDAMAVEDAKECTEVMLEEDLSEDFVFL